MKKIIYYSIIFEDEKIVAVNKASGISIGGDRYDETKERLDKLLEKDLKIKLFTVHRIDKDTSGLVIFAKDKETHKKLSVAFENRNIEKKYIAIVHGRTPWQEKICDLSLVPNGNKKHMTIIDKYKGKKSLTKFNLIKGSGNYSILEAMPETGRIHQIRVHAAAIGHPVVCDELYGKINPVKLSSFKRGWKGDPFEEKPLLSRLGLHSLELILPDGKKLEAPLAKDMSALINQLNKN
ncbi:MAG: RNA pseudouridine synthase [Treponema sp.]|jgi:RluA family pseudouridine synthase|nr:RNA pseudouridine synthase [Treponema sp.]